MGRHSNGAGHYDNVRGMVMFPSIPKRCQLVHQALSGLLGETEFTRRVGWWRYIDIINITGRNSSERKLRELIQACPGMVESKIEKGNYKMFRLKPQTAIVNGLLREKVTTSTPGQLFDLPPIWEPTR